MCIYTTRKKWKIYMKFWELPSCPLYVVLCTLRRPIETRGTFKVDPSSVENTLIYEALFHLPHWMRDLGRRMFFIYHHYHYYYQALQYSRNRHRLAYPSRIKFYELYTKACTFLLATFIFFEYMNLGWIPSTASYHYLLPQELRSSSQLCTDPS